jgi:hypothetical protein
MFGRTEDSLSSYAEPLGEGRPTEWTFLLAFILVPRDLGAQRLISRIEVQRLFRSSRTVPRTMDLNVVGLLSA